MVELHTTASNKTGRQIKRRKTTALGDGGQPHTAGTSRLEHQAPLDELQLHWNLVYTALEHPCCWLVPTQALLRQTSEEHRDCSNRKTSERKIDEISTKTS